MRGVEGEGTKRECVRFVVVRCGALRFQSAQLRRCASSCGTRREGNSHRLEACATLLVAVTCPAGATFFRIDGLVIWAEVVEGCDAEEGAGVRGVVDHAAGCVAFVAVHELVADVFAAYLELDGFELVHGWSSLPAALRMARRMATGSSLSL